MTFAIRTPAPASICRVRGLIMKVVSQGRNSIRSNDSTRRSDALLVRINTLPRLVTNVTNSDVPPGLAKAR